MSSAASQLSSSPSPSILSATPPLLFPASTAGCDSMLGANLAAASGARQTGHCTLDGLTARDCCQRHHPPKHCLRTASNHPSILHLALRDCEVASEDGATRTSLRLAAGSAAENVLSPVHAMVALQLDRLICCLRRPLRASACGGEGQQAYGAGSVWRVHLCQDVLRNKSPRFPKLASGHCLVECRAGRHASEVSVCLLGRTTQQDDSRCSTSLRV